jgi:ABC-type lipoprotein export system ATPase subunit
MTEQAAKILQLDSVSKRYAPVEGAEGSLVLDEVSLSVSAGESLSIMGPSGSGKSTLLNIMGALDRPTGGRVLLEGTDLAGCDDRELARIRRERVGFVFQAHHLLPQCTALENVLVPVLAGDRKNAPDEIRDRAAALLERVGLGHRLSHKPGLLSGGERQRVAVVRSLINRPALLLCDEPTGDLDRKSSEGLADLLVELNREEKVTLIVATHSETLASRMAVNYELRDGRLNPKGGA